MSNLPSGTTVLGEYEVFHEGNQPRMVILLQWQYDALPVSKNTDDKLYVIVGG